MNFDARLAVPEDATDISRILNEANAHKLTQGDNLWGNYPFTEAEVLEFITTGNAHLGSVDEAPAASVIVTREDARMWGPERGTDQSALYVHKLAVAEAFRGLGLSQKILQYVVGMAQEQNRPHLRLDAPTQNDKLREVYRNLGFTELEDVARPSKGVNSVYLGTLFQFEVCPPSK